ncbi:protein translocase subunit SecD [Myxococcota bacterium]|nr:protein translocase subunit SecD [Myxococcota bacterium]
MSSNLRLRGLLVAAVLLLLGYFALANFVPKQQRTGSGWLPDDGLRLGLDLQGGIHWVVGVELASSVKHELEALGGRLGQRLEDEGVRIDGWVADEGGLRIEGASETVQPVVETWATETGVLVETGDDPLTYVLTDEWRAEVEERGMSQVLEVLRRRIADPIQGIPDSVVTRQGTDRVLVQIPGGQLDRASARELLRSTGFLEFKLVEDTAATEESLLADHGGEVPDGSKLAFERDKESGRVINAFLVGERADITGEYLTDARMNFDRVQRPIVEFTFNTKGGELFQQLTGDNIGEALAIILDDNVYSAPVIRSQIGLRGQIEGRFTSQEAADLAVVLRSGALSVPVEILEERSIGPALGADSIERGVRASILGLVLVVIFVVVYYRLSGVYAAIALFANLMLLIGVMSLFEATLTLPGLAGIVLTVGMAVDANVIIFERIREELRSDKTPRAAVATGFSKAVWTILDANITTLLTALVLFEYGTGPIKGFAVTLSIGVVTSVFSALVITRLLFEIYPGSRHVEQVSI